MNKLWWYQFFHTNIQLALIVHFQYRQHTYPNCLFPQQHFFRTIIFCVTHPSPPNLLLVFSLWRNDTSIFSITVFDEGYLLLPRNPPCASGRGCGSRRDSSTQDRPHRSWGATLITFSVQNSHPQHQSPAEMKPENISIINPEDLVIFPEVGITILSGFDFYLIEVEKNNYKTEGMSLLLSSTSNEFTFRTQIKTAWKAHQY